MAATPAAEPMIKALPPVPVAYAKNTQKKWSVGYWSKLYMPCDAATNGTLSTTAESKPIVVTMIVSLLIVFVSHCASWVNCPVACKADMLISMPKKNKILGVSILRKAFATLKASNINCPTNNTCNQSGCSFIYFDAMLQSNCKIAKYESDYDC